MGKIWRIVLKGFVFALGFGLFLAYLLYPKQLYLSLPDLNNVDAFDHPPVSLEKERNEFVKTFKNTFQANAPFREHHDLLDPQYRELKDDAAYYRSFESRIRKNELTKEGCGSKKRYELTVHSRYQNSEPGSRVFTVCFIG